MTDNLFLVSAVFGALLILLGLPLALGKVRPNRFYGFRTLKTLSEEWYWYSANRYAGRAVTAAGLATLLPSLIFLFVELPLGEALTILLFFTVDFVPVLAAGAASFLHLERLK